MYRTIVGALALVAFVQFSGGVTIGTTHFVDIVAQKLENHHRGENLDNKITIDDCRAAYDEFEQWALEPETYRFNIHEGPLAVARDYLSDFLHKHLEHDLEGRLTNEFIEKLESTYERVRASYGHKTSLQCEPGITTTPKTCALVASLTGKGEPLTAEMIQDSWDEMDDIFDRAYSISKGDRIFEDTDEFLKLFKPYNTPEVDALFIAPMNVMKLLTTESEQKLNERDPEEIQKYTETYKNELAKYLSLVEE